MKTIKKNVYYCDFCSKKGLSAATIKKHELSCTANPNRICKLCLLSEKEQAKNSELEYLRAKFYKFVTEDEYEYLIIKDINKFKEVLQELRTKTSNCPCCILAILRRFGLAGYLTKQIFDFQSELKSTMQELNEDKLGRYNYGY